MIGTSYSTIPPRANPNAVHPLGKISSDDMQLLQSNLRATPSSSIGQQAKAGAIEGAGGFIGALEQASRYNPMTVGGQVNIGQELGRLVGIPQPTEQPLAGPMVAQQTVQGMGIPGPQSMAQSLTREGVRGGMAALPFGLPGGPAAMMTAVTSGAAGDIATSNAEKVLSKFEFIPEMIRKPLAVAAGVVAGMIPSAVRGRFFGSDAQKAANRVERTTTGAFPEGQDPGQITRRDLLKPGKAGLENLAESIDKPLSKALRVDPVDATEQLAKLDAQIKTHNETVYGPALKSGGEPVMARATPNGISSRLVTVLEHPDVRRAIKGAWDEINRSPEGDMPRAVPLDPIYDNAGRLTLEAQTRGVPLQVLDLARRKFADFVETAGENTGLQRTTKRDWTTKTTMLRNATDAELKAMGDERLIAARKGTERLETMREQVQRGMDLLNESGVDARGQRVAETPALIRAQIKEMEAGPNGAEAVKALREGVFTAAKEQLLRNGSLSNDQLQRIVAVLPPGGDVQALVNAWRRGMMTGEVGAQAGTRGPVRQGEISKAELGAVELGSGIVRRGIAHIVQGVLHGSLTRGQQAAIQSFLSSPDGVEIFRRALEAADATSVSRGVGSAVGAMTSGTRPAQNQTAQ